jgi:hypothetical protein
MNSERLEQLGGLQVDDSTGRIVREDDVRRVEHHIGAVLPDDYRTFLLKYGSGQAYFNESVGLPLETHPNGACCINAFFGAVPLENSYCYDLVTYFDQTRIELPGNALPIADEGGGSYICLAVAGDNAGSIYFWDHEEYTTEDEPTYKYMQHVAPSFSEFVGMLKIYNWE